MWPEIDLVSITESEEDMENKKTTIMKINSIWPYPNPILLLVWIILLLLVCIIFILFWQKDS